MCGCGWYLISLVVCSIRIFPKKHVRSLLHVYTTTMVHDWCLQHNVICIHLVEKNLNLGEIFGISFAAIFLICIMIITFCIGHLSIKGMLLDACALVYVCASCVNSAAESKVKCWQKNGELTRFFIFSMQFTRKNYSNCQTFFPPKSNNFGICFFYQLFYKGIISKTTCMYVNLMHANIDVFSVCVYIVWI